MKTYENDWDHEHDWDFWKILINRGDKMQRKLLNMYMRKSKRSYKYIYIYIYIYR